MASIVRTPLRLVMAAAAVLTLAAAVPAQAAAVSATDGAALRALADVDRPTCGHVVRLASPFAQGTCSGVRPGAIVRMRQGRCTMNFLFRGSDRRYYIGTAGHCAPNERYGEKAWRASDYHAPTAADSRGYWIGNYAYRRLDDVHDFALIRLNAWIHPSASMCHFGGPDGMYTKHESTPTKLEYFGNGIYWGQNMPARTAVASDTTDPNTVFAIGTATPGDSGSGVLDQRGEAVGVLVETFAYSNPAPGTAPPINAAMVITRLDTQIARAQKVLHVRLSLRSATYSSDTSL